MASAFDHQSQVVFAREVDRGRDVTRVARRYGVSAGSRRPRVEPTGNLRACDLIAG